MASSVKLKVVRGMQIQERVNDYETRRNLCLDNVRVLGVLPIRYFEIGIVHVTAVIRKAKIWIVVGMWVWVMWVWVGH